MTTNLVNPLQDQLHQTLRSLHAPEKFAQSPLLHAPLVTKQQSTLSTTPSQALSTVLEQLRNQLQQQDAQAADLLRGRFWEGLTVDTMVQQQRPEPQSARRFYQQQEQAIRLLVQLWEKEETLATIPPEQKKLVHRLPTATYGRLFGVDSIVEQIVHDLLTPHTPAIIAIKGIGGIGKTATADNAVRAVLQQPNSFQQVAWISAKQEFLTQSGIKQYRNGTGTGIRLAQIFDDLGEQLGLSDVSQLPLTQKIDRLAGPLRQTPHLVIIDNLETVEDFQELVPWLARLAEPTRFLLTSRETVPALARVVTVDLDELAKPAAVALIQHVAAEKHVSDYDEEAIYNLVGGNPLAIILIVSLMHHLEPATIFAAVQSGSTEALYTYIYRQSWYAISQNAKELLFTIQRAGDVAEWEWLALMNGNRLDLLQATLMELLDFSLLYCQGGANGERRYAIHRLTSTFLRTDLLGWV